MAQWNHVLADMCAFSTIAVRPLHAVTRKAVFSILSTRLLLQLLCGLFLPPVSLCLLALHHFPHPRDDVSLLHSQQMAGSINAVESARKPSVRASFFNEFLVKVSKSNA
jgi:hypothetical protein